MYQSKLGIKETQKAIQLIKAKFSQILTNSLNLIRVSAPLFLNPKTGLNDNLNGETPVIFNVLESEQKLEIVQSLAKWKRHALAEYDLKAGEGLYTDMNAIRPQEVLSPLHSYYVDQWDWELHILPIQRTEAFLEAIVSKIYSGVVNLHNNLKEIYPNLNLQLPSTVYFINSQELEDLYPDFSPLERETLIVKKHQVVFIKKIGWKLKSGVEHSKRAFDYDDWNLNGDLIVYHPPLDCALELSSMGIRVDKQALIDQSQKSLTKLVLMSNFHKSLIENTLPFSIGGGIGQSRLCMLLLEKVHIGEVQVSYWSEQILKEAIAQNIKLL